MGVQVSAELVRRWNARLRNAYLFVNVVCQSCGDTMPLNRAILNPPPEDI